MQEQAFGAMKYKGFGFISLAASLLPPVQKKWLLKDFISMK